MVPVLLILTAISPGAGKGLEGHRNRTLVRPSNLLKVQERMTTAGSSAAEPQL